MTTLVRFTFLFVGLVVLRAAVDYQLDLYAVIAAQLMGAF
jgi:hypothetical protein